MKRSDLMQPGMNGAFVADGFGLLPLPVTPSGQKLADKRLAVKDVFDVAGLRTGAGNPAWLAEQAIATRTALPVRMLLDEGAQWIGKTVTDELTYSLAGINAHYGTPVNPADASRIPGGSSSGSAAAVAGGLADIGLGTDCGGSIRLPASYCGIWGIRPTHGRIAANGCVTLAHSFDTVGWFTRDAQTLIDVFELLAHAVVPVSTDAATLRVPQEALALLNPEVRARFDETMQGLGDIEQSAMGTFDFAAWGRAFRLLQGADIAQQHAAWAREHMNDFGADVRSRFEACLTIDRDELQAAQCTRVAAIRAMAQAFDAPGRYWLMPTLPWIAPRTDATREKVDEVRARSQQLLCIAGLAGLPQVSFPWTTFHGAPLGLSVIGARGDDEGVLALARELHAKLDVSALPELTDREP
jgi:amidase